MPQLKLKRLPHGVGLPLPAYTTEGAAAMDIASAEYRYLWRGETAILKTGFAVEVPAGYELQIRSRSGLAAKHGVFVLNGPGTIDEDYRGELLVILNNSGMQSVEIKGGDRIAQLVLAPVVRPEVVEVDELSVTVRATGGLGSTGR